MWTTDRSPLPGIGQSSTRNSTLALVDPRKEQLTSETDVEEVTKHNRNSPDHLGSAALPGFTSSRLLHLESRTNANEQAYRSLLEEIVRLQGEVRTSVRRNDDLWKDERRERFQVRDGLEATSDGQASIEKRLSRIEEAGEKDRRVLRSLVEHVQHVESAVEENRRISETRREQQKAWSQRFQEDLENAASGIRQLTEQMQRQILDFSAELKQVKRAEKERSVDIYQVLVELRKQSGALEVEQKDMGEALSHLNAKANHLEVGLTQTRARLEARWNDLGEVLIEMKRSITKVGREGRAQEEQLKQRVSDFQERLFDFMAKEDSHKQAFQKKFNDWDQRHRNSEQQTTEQISSLAEELNKRIICVETKANEEIDSKIANIETSLKGEMDLRDGSNKDSDLKIQRDLEVLNGKVDDQVSAMRNGLKLDRMQVSQSLSQLHEAITLIESQSDASSDKLKRVIQAEIKTRHEELERLQQRCSELQEKLSSSLSQVQKSMATMAVRMDDDGDLVQLEVKKQLTDANEQTRRQLNDFDARMTSLSSQVTHLVETNSSRIEQIQRMQKDSQLSGVQTLTLNQEATQSRLKEMQSQFAALSSQISEANERLQLQRIDLSSRIEAEKQARLRDIQAWRREISGKVNQDAFERVHGDSGQRLSELESKLAQAVSQVLEFETTLHGLKVDVNGRVSSEATMRTEALLDMKQEFGRIQSQLVQLEFLVHHRVSPSQSFQMAAVAGEHGLPAEGGPVVDDQIIEPVESEMGPGENPEGPLESADNVEGADRERPVDGESGSGEEITGEISSLPSEVRSTARETEESGEQDASTLPGDSQTEVNDGDSAKPPVEDEIDRVLAVLGGTQGDGQSNDANDYESGGGSEEANSSSPETERRRSDSIEAAHVMTSSQAQPEERSLAE